MIKSPFKRNGQINSFELLKIFFLVSFIMAQISRLFTNVINNNSNQILSIVVIVLLSIQLIISNIELNRIITEIIKTYVIKLTFKKTKFYIEFPLEISYINIKVNSFEKSYIRLQVIRC